MIRLGDKVFQSSDVKGAVCSGDFELDKRASGVSFCMGGSLVFEDLVIELPGLYDFCPGKDHNRK